MTSNSMTIPRVRPLAALLSLALCVNLHAQSITPQNLPNTGQLLQQIPAAPAPTPSSAPNLQLDQPSRPRADESRSFLVRHIAIEGNHLLPTAQLHALVADAEGKQLNLEQLYTLADRISEAYRQAGYPLSRAYVPAQKLHDDSVTIDVVEARYGKVVLNNQSRVSDHPLNAALAPLQAGQPVSDWQLERSLLLLSDVPGADSSSSVAPGTAPGTSDLLVNVTSAPRYTGLLSLDDYGNAYTHRERLGGNFDVNGLFDQGDLLDLNALSSGGAMNYFSAGYRYLLDGQGTTLRAGISSLHYHLEDGLEPLDAHGSALVGSLTLSQPLIRNSAANLYAQLEFDHKLLKDDIEAVDIDTNRQDNLWTLTLAGDQRDHTGVTNYNLGISHGDIHYTELLAEIIDDLTTRNAGSFNRYNLSVSRLQQFDADNAVYVGYSQQWANKNLDSAEQFFLGGPNTVRGYDTGALAGAQGNLLNLEFRHDFSWSIVPGRFQAAVFADTGHLQVYKQPFAAGQNSGHVSSAGLGLHWSGPQQWVVSASVAKPIGNTPELLANTSTRTRFWLQLSKGFQ